MSNVAVKAELVSSISTLVQIEADMPRTKAALSEALRIGAEEMTAQITKGMITPVIEAEPTTDGTKKRGNGKDAKAARRRERGTNLLKLAAELAPEKGKRRSPAQAKKMKQVVFRELKNGTTADRLASLFNTTVGNINQMRYR
jgi:hypothetical protein